MAQNQHVGFATSLPMHMWACGALDQDAATAEMSFDQCAESGCRQLQLGNIERRRLDVHQHGEVGEHCIEVECSGGEKRVHTLRLGASHDKAQPGW
jgi:hypothetical protein